MDEVPDAGQRLAPGEWPQGLGYLFGLHDAVALADEVLENLAGPLLKPVPAQRALATVDPDSAQGLDRQLGFLDPVGV